MTTALRTGALPLRLLLGAAVALAAVPVAPAAAAGADARPAPEALEQAREHFSKGKALQAAGAYDGAIAEYQAAYALAPLPDLIFNLAQCARLKGDKRTALAEYKRYLAAAPGGRGAADARKQIAQLGKEVADDDARLAQQAEAERSRREAGAAAEPQRSGAPGATAPGNQAPAAGGSAPGVTAVAPPPPAPEPPPAQRARRLRIAGLITAGAGAALIAGGIGFGLRARSISDDLAALPGRSDPTWDQELYDSGKAAERNMYILLGVGGGAVVAGGVLYLLGHRAGREPVATSVTASWLPHGGASLAVSGRF